MTAQELDQTEVATFTQQLVAIMTGGRLSLMISIGHRTGLFDAIAGLPPATSDTIAEAAGLNERYVREWLGAMTCGRIVAYDPVARTYRLPAEHAAVLTRTAGIRNMAMMAQPIALFGMVEDAIVECFRTGGGVPYADYPPRFRQLIAELTARVHDAALIDRILTLVPGLPDRLRAGIDVADIGCGSGHALNLMARAFPASRFTGYDFDEDALRAARIEAESLGLANARFELKDVATLALDGGYDLITAFDAIHDLARPRDALWSIARALRPDGVFLMVDVGASSNLDENLDHPLAAGLYVNSTMYCLTVSLAQGGEGLGAMWGEQTVRQYLADAGFTRVEVRRIEGDMINNYYIAAKQ
jgi:SAM-dependent methyltransferase